MTGREKKTSLKVFAVDLAILSVSKNIGFF